MKNKQLQYITIQDVQLLKKICNQFGTPLNNEKKSLLRTFSQMPIENVSVIKEYHDCLLFILAYPEDHEQYGLAHAELQRISLITQEIANGSNQLKKLQLSFSGIINSTITARFSFELVKWISAEFPSNIAFHSSDAEISKQKDILKLLLPSAEHEAFEKHFSSLNDWLIKSRSYKDFNALKTLIDFLETSAASAELNDHFYDELQIFVDIKVAEKLMSRTSARINQGNLFYHNSELIKKVDPEKTLLQKISKPLKISKWQKEQLNTIAKCSLLMLLRETDPVTYCSDNATELHDMGRGIKIGLFYLKKDRRLPVESYVGYMAFKNNIPVAYGGGWILGNFSRIGINIYPPFRGGESALLFVQILRLYKQRFNISIFEAEPYQIGKNNNEGIKSGAFWFYYRLGFRPSQINLLKLAESEQLKIHADKSYRTNEKTLRKLADAFMVLKFKDNTREIISTLQISEAITEVINTEFKGNRKAFIEMAGKTTAKALRINTKTQSTLLKLKAYADLAPLFFLDKNINQWKASDKAKAIKLIHAKNQESEHNFIQLLQSHEKLLSELIESTR